MTESSTSLDVSFNRVNEAPCLLTRAGLKYTVKVSRRGPQSFRVFLGSSHVDVVARKLNDGGLLVQVTTPEGGRLLTNCQLPVSHLLTLHAPEIVTSKLLRAAMPAWSACMLCEASMRRRLIRPFHGAPSKHKRRLSGRLPGSQQACFGA